MCFFDAREAREQVAERARHGAEIGDDAPAPVGEEKVLADGGAGDGAPDRLALEAHRAPADRRGLPVGHEDADGSVLRLALGKAPGDGDEPDGGGRGRREQSLRPAEAAISAARIGSSRMTISDMNCRLS